jgi:urocanate hydratase
MTKEEFRAAVGAGIPDSLPAAQPYDTSVNHAPRRKDILTPAEKRLAVKNALRYFPEHLHAELAREFAGELETYGRIYMYRFRPSYEMYARPIEDYPARSRQAAAIMMMIQNNLDPRVAQHPHELITYGGNGAVFQNWAQYLLTLGDDRLADTGDVFRPSARSFPLPPRRSARHRHKRHGDPQLFQTR